MWEKQECLWLLHSAVFTIPTAGIWCSGLPWYTQRLELSGALSKSSTNIDWMKNHSLNLNFRPAFITAANVVLRQFSTSQGVGSFKEKRHGRALACCESDETSPGKHCNTVLVTGYQRIPNYLYVHYKECFAFVKCWCGNITITIRISEAVSSVGRGE